MQLFNAIERKTIRNNFYEYYLRIYLRLNLRDLRNLREKKFCDCKLKYYDNSVTNYHS